MSESRTLAREREIRARAWRGKGKLHNEEWTPVKKGGVQEEK